MPDESTPDPAIPFPPMEAELVRELPEGDGWWYEPKWDGFRGVLENVGRRARALVAERAAAASLLPRAAAARRADAAALGARRRDRDRARGRARLRRDADAAPPGRVAHPQAVGRDPGRVRRLRPAALGRRARLAAAARGAPRRARAGREGLPALAAHGRPRTRRAAGSTASRRSGSTASSRRRPGLPYLPGSREGIVKVKEHKTADCVVIGVRWKKGSRTEIATLLLGLYRDDGEVDYVGTCAVAASRRDRGGEARAAAARARQDRRTSPSRAAGARASSSRRGCAQELVVEVRYDKVQGNRFRHGTKWLRWRDDKDPRDCTWRELRPPRDPNAPQASSRSSTSSEVRERQARGTRSATAAARTSGRQSAGSRSTPRRRRSPARRPAGERVAWMSICPNARRARRRAGRGSSRSAAAEQERAPNRAMIASGSPGPENAARRETASAPRTRHTTRTSASLRRTSPPL